MKCKSKIHNKISLSQKRIRKNKNKILIKQRKKMLQVINQSKIMLMMKIMLLEKIGDILINHFNCKKNNIIVCIFKNNIDPNKLILLFNLYFLWELMTRFI